ncbi:MAG TPA: hypothetical protein VKQ73_02750 [Stellaceae bacterium]|nr:hypothetical protein [Stellaceae bacterium]
MQILAYLLARFSEPSSYAGLGAILALAGWNIPDPFVGQLVQLLAAACGLLALGLKERGLIRAIVLVFAIAPALAGCGGVPAAVLGGLGSAGSALTVVDKLSQAASPYIATACQEYQKGKAAADATVAAGIVPKTIAAKVTSIESFGDAACTNPPSGDPLSTAIWLGQLAGQITTLTSPAP